MSCTRRRLLQGSLVAGAALALPRWGRAQTSPAAASLPKVALVLGNGKYRDAPLRNPVNDARAIAAALGPLGFAVTLKTDVSRAEMTAAVQAHVAELARRKAVGLFYYAGHAVQLAWRNYMLPVDAGFESVADIQAHGVELAGLLDGLGRAATALNLIILDACRDNPFGAGVEQKGLSQMDAPRNTLLAYATSPGNVASDGAGANGLYTEHLLREMAARDTKVEDVFKRVRLGVRRQSNGAQVPWESTSLEEDFYFVPPARPDGASAAEQERQFTDELALWEKTQGGTDPAPLEAYLRRHPSGRFAELAQLQLDRVLARRGERKIQLASTEGNPFTRGSVTANTGWRVGDSYTYRITDRGPVSDERGPVFTAVFNVVDVTESEVRFGNGQVLDPLGNTLRRPGGRVYTANQLEPVEYAVGKRWRTEFRVSTPKGAEGTTTMDLRIAARESVTVPAGTFNAFRVEGHGVFDDRMYRHPEETRLKKWSAPDRLRMPVALEEIRQRSGNRNTRLLQSRRWELLSFREG